MSREPAGAAPSSERVEADPELYPDLAAAGGLQAALEKAAADLDPGELPSGEPDMEQEGAVPGAAPAAGPTARRDALAIHLGSVERRFIVSGWSRGVELVRGGTADLAEVAKAAAAWRSGESLHELRDLCPFLDFGELAEAHERGPAEAVTVKWRQLREALREPVPFPNIRELMEAAFVEPRLRQLFPFTSHWSLHFTTCTGFPYTWVVPFVDPLRDGRFRVCGPSRGTVIGEADSVDDALALVLAHLPADIGPAVAGTARD
ncbi:DUF6193 family natural product biosynthesis protein [Streptomyces sp. NPDC020917]|uniref:DUF6193 family natural product biosynthesis protein n=1 Tax=Streptomyces sp. NPDC020917 TaxID=3365102 RepID=UPI00379451D6